ncbi:pickpocket protein 28-like [Sitodiplosis mosellana]|uniref:pickpocket protein 28-like n=1 Tax=Sitodiplosis mosellana TaxID=263140 RepID=UPI002445084C|nr:pickpocket protein 28-like [Sitodiplosis mosellana]
MSLNISVPKLNQPNGIGVNTAQNSQIVNEDTDKGKDNGVYEYVKEFCSETTVHGIRYFTRGNSAERVTPVLMTVHGNPNTTHWNVEDGYDSNVDQSIVYPYRVFGTGLRYSILAYLIVLLNNDHQYCNDASRGFTVTIHSPDELPRPGDDFIRIPVEHKFSTISIKPSMITTSSGLRNYLPQARGCFFRTERSLRFFKSYNQRNCELECKANFFKQTCGCVTYYMPRDIETNVCAASDIQCQYEADKNFSRNSIVDQCQCLPDCTSITYDVEIWPESMTDDSGSPNFSEHKIRISFKKPHFITIIRIEASTMADFIASCGGLLGLFMGFSLLSIIELVFFYPTILVQYEENEIIGQSKDNRSETSSMKV